MSAIIAAIFFQLVINAPTTFEARVTVSYVEPGGDPIELTEASGCSDIWSSDQLGGGKVNLFDNAPEDHRVTVSGSCQYASETLEEAEAVSLP
jgi:hypothetical protein